MLNLTDTLFDIKIYNAINDTTITLNYKQVVFE